MHKKETFFVPRKKSQQCYSVKTSSSIDRLLFRSNGLIKSFVVLMNIFDNKPPVAGEWLAKMASFVYDRTVRFVRTDNNI